MAGVTLRNGLAALLAVPIAGFFGFVGWNKATAPLADLARHHAWTVHLPEWLGRLVGLSEMVLAAGLILTLVPAVRHWGRISALALVANQAVAAGVHLLNGETSALPQNAVLVIGLLGIAVVT